MGSGGDIYISGLDPPTVFKIDQAGTATQIMDASGDGAGNSLYAAGDIEVAPDGRVYCSTTSHFGAGWPDTNDVFQIMPDGSVSLVLDHEGAGAGELYWGPGVIAIAPDGTTYVAALESDNVYRLGVADQVPSMGSSGITLLAIAFCGTGAAIATSRSIQIGTRASPSQKTRS